jgi:hypothetical protein
LKPKLLNNGKYTRFDCKEEEKKVEVAAAAVVLPQSLA